MTSAPAASFSSFAESTFASRLPKSKMRYWSVTSGRTMAPRPSRSHEEPTVSGMDSSISRRRKQLNSLTRGNKRYWPIRARLPSVMRAPRPCARWDCDARQRRSDRPGCRREPDRISCTAVHSAIRSTVSVRSSHLDWKRVSNNFVADT